MRAKHNYELFLVYRTVSQTYRHEKLLSVLVNQSQERPQVPHEGLKAGFGQIYDENLVVCRVLQQLHDRVPDLVHRVENDCSGFAGFASRGS